MSKETEFEIGMHVRLTEDMGGSYPVAGDVGVIIDFDNDYDPVVDFTYDNHCHFTDSNGCYNPRHQWIFKRKLEIFEPTKSFAKGGTMLNSNTSAIKQAARLEAGSIAIKQLMTFIKPHLPMMVRGYADNALANVVAANLFAYVVKNYAADNANAVAIADAMLEGAMLDTVKSFNINEIVNNLTDKVDISALAAKLTK